MSSGPILIVGKSGRVASALVQAAALRAVNVRALGRPELDICNRGSIARALASLDPCAIINAAGLVVVDQAEREPEHALALNRDGAAHLATVAAQRRIPFLHISTDYVFDGASTAPYTEDDAPAPLSVYGRSKVAGEQAVLSIYPESLVVRTGWVYGPHGTNFFTTMLTLASKQDVVRVVSDQHGTPTAMSDLAGALLAMTADLVTGKHDNRRGLYHVAGGGGTTWLGFAESIFAGWQRRGHRVPRIEPISVDAWPGPARRPRYSRLDCSKVRRDFGIALPDWQESLEPCLDMFARAETASG